jgi:hypothetical protein
MKGFRKKLFYLILIIIVVAQFIQPTKNISPGLSENDISKTVAIPETLHKTFISKCYDCHSNNTNYPWYANVQPIGWWLAAHVHEGKEHLDFSEFKTYKPERAEHKLEEIGEVLEDGSMPLKAYTILHQDAVVTADEVKAINEWLASLGVTAEKH